jgi:hypothetical protein
VPGSTGVFETRRRTSSSRGFRKHCLGGVVSDMMPVCRRWLRLFSITEAVVVAIAQ